MTTAYLHFFNILGLVINAFGACLLIFFTSPQLDVTATGDNITTWVNNELPSEQRAANLKKYKKHKYGFKGGVIMLTIGYALQLLSVILG